MNAKLMKALDSSLGRIAVSLLPKASKCRYVTRTESILMIRPGGIGDAVHLMPAILAIGKIHPNASITVLAERRNAGVFRLCPNVGKILLYERLKDFLAAMAGKYDIVIDTEQWHRLSAVVARLSNAPTLIGYATNERIKLFNHPIQYSHDSYEVDSFFDLLAPLGIKKSEKPHEQYLTIPELVENRAGNLLAGFSTKPFIVIFPGASIPERRWGSERFGQIAEILQNKGIAVVVVGGKEDKIDGEKIIHRVNGLNLAGKTNLVETAAVIDKSSLLLSGDSGILHIGVGLGKPTVSLFGPGITKKWAPSGENHVVLKKNLPCSPCTKFGYTPKCPINAKCMTDIAVNEVFDIIMNLLGKTGNLPKEKK
jgi:ADP-heptose:LPS heptosyltransferase